MMELRKRVIAMLLAVSMAVSACPVTAFAQAVPETQAVPEEIPEAPVEDPAQIPEAASEAASAEAPEEPAPEEQELPSEPPVEEPPEEFSGSLGSEVLWILDPEGVLTISGSGDMAQQEVFPWESLADRITAIVIEEGITAVPSYAFWGCTGILSVSIPAGVIAIGEQAFGCEADAVFGSPVTVSTPDLAAWCAIAFEDAAANPLHRGGDLVADGALVTELMLPESVTRIPDFCFSGADCLTGATLHPNLVSLGNGAFRNCSGLTSITWEGSAPAFGTGVFSGVTATAHYPAGDSTWDSVIYEELGGDITWESYRNGPVVLQSGFCGSTLTWTLDDTGTLTISGAGNMTEYSASSYPWYAWREDIVAVNLGPEVTAIGTYAFAGMNRVKRMVVPDNVTTIGYAAFNDWDSLEEITLPYAKRYASDSTPFGLLFSGSTSTVTTGWTRQGSYYYKIPASLKKVTLTKETVLTSYAFQNCVNLTQVHLPEGLEAIGSYAFDGCTNLVRASIPASVTTISNNAFSRCASLAALVIPAGVAQIGSSAFDGCSGAQSLTIPQGVRIIGDYAFRGCSGISSLSLPQSLTSIGTRAFQGMDQITRLVVPDSVETINYGAFEDWNSLEEITLPYARRYASDSNPLGLLFSGSTSTVTAGWTRQGSYYYKIPASLKKVTITKESQLLPYAFQNCANLTEIHLNDEISTIGSYAFENCAALERIEIPGNVTGIDFQAFSGCTSLTQVTFPEGLTRIDEHAFLGCSRITSLSLPQSLTQIGTRAFQGLNQVKELVVPDSVHTIGYAAFSGWDSLEKITLPYAKRYASDTSPFGILFSGSTSTVTAGWTHQGSYYYQIPASLREVTVTKETVITGYAFQNCSNLTRINLNDGVTAIGSYAFQNCTGLTQSPLVPTVAVIRDHAFDNCPLIPAVTFPEVLTTIGAYGFRGCTNLRRIALPEGLTSIGDHAFQNCSNVTSLSLPQSLTQIGIYAFQGMRQVKEILVPDNVHTIGYAAFNGCDSLEKIKLPYARRYASDTSPFGVLFSGATSTVTAGWTRQGSYYYQIPASLREVTLTKETIIIGYAFQNCAKLTRINLNDSITAIGSYAFDGCSGLTAMPSLVNVSTISNCAFQGCGSISQIILPTGLTRIEDQAFQGMDQVTQATIPDAVTYLGSRILPATVKSITFLGSAPTISGQAFSVVTAAAAFPVEDETWTDDKLKNYGGTLTWTGYATEEAGVYSGVCGTDAAWTLENGVLTISGTGPMTHYVSQISVPWRRYTGMIRSVVMEEGITAIGSHAFHGCAALEQISIPQSVTVIGASAFQGCERLVTVAIPAGITILEESVFQGCAALTDITLPDALTEIKAQAFRSCAGLNQMNFPDGLTLLGDYAFAECTGLQTMVFQGVAPTLCANTFSGVTATAHYPANGSTWESVIAGSYGGTLTWTPLIYLGHVGELKASRIYSRSIELSWEAVEEEDVTGYRICRDGVQVGITEDCHFLDRGLTTGTAYTYQVYVQLSNGAQSPAAALTVTPAAPSITMICPDPLADQEQTLLLAQVPNQGNLEELEGRNTAVEVYYESDGGDVLLGQARQTGLTEEAGSYEFLWHSGDLPEGTYQVTFVITDPDGGTGSDSQEYIIHRTLPEKITGLTAIGAVDGIHLSWNIAREVSSTYILYRRDSASDTFTALATISNRSQLTWLDTSADEETLYTYYVAAVDSYGREGQASDAVSATRAVDKERPQITGVTPATGQTLHGGLRFQVTAIDNVAPVSVRLEYSRDKKAWVCFQEPVNGTFAGSLDSSVLADGRLYVRAIAYDAAGNASAAWVNTYALDNTGPQPVEGLDYTATCVTATLYWQAPAEEDVAFFRVERNIGENRYAEVATVRDSLGCSIPDLTPGMTYHYRVVAYDQTGNRGIPTADLAVVTAADTIAPVVTRLRPAPGCYRDTIPVTAQVTDESGVAAVTLQTSRDGLVWTDVTTQTNAVPVKDSTMTHALDVSQSAEGVLCVRAIARDAAGNQSIHDTSAPYVQYIVDRTAPAAPENVTLTAENGRLSLTWSQGSETDLRHYSVSRAESEAGPYDVIASGLQALGYVDRTVQAGTTYYYQVAAEDQAGNISPGSQPVSGQIDLDTVKAVVHSIYPASRSRLSANQRSIRVLASDNRALDSIVIQYSLDGQTYQLLGQGTGLNPGGDTYTASLPVEQFKDGTIIHVQAYALDKTGNRSDMIDASYTLDRSAPTVADASAAVSENAQGIEICWKDCGEEDLAGFRVYRKAGVNGTYTQIAARTASSEGSYSVVDGYAPAVQTVLYYRIESLDTCGNVSGAIVSVSIEPEVIQEVTKDRTAPLAVITCESQMRTGVEYVLDGSTSQDNVGITDWEFRLGDLVLSRSKSVIHVFDEPGDYTVTLKVADQAGNVSEIDKVIQVQEQLATATVQIRVTDQYGAAAAHVPVYFDLGQENQVVRKTDASGQVSFASTPGKHTVGAFLGNNEWLPVQRELVVAANMVTTAQLTMVKQPLIEGDFEVERMTFEEITAAGIDVSKSENQQIIRVNVTAQFATGTAVTSMVCNPDTGEIIQEPEPIEIEIRDSDGSTELRQWIPIPLTGKGQPSRPGGGSILPPDDSGSGTPDDSDEPEKEEDPFALMPGVAFLEIPVEARYLKEFFDVKLHIVNNAASEFSMLESTVTLNVPRGMSLMLEGGSGSTVEIPVIPGQSQETVGWILRGDTAGDYDLTAEFTGTMSLFNQQVHAAFGTREPIKVYGLDAVELHAELNSTIRNDAFYFRLSLVNTSGIDIHMPSIDVMGDVIRSYLEGREEDPWRPSVTLLSTTVTNATGYSQAIGPDQQVSTLASGGALTREYAVYDVVDADVYNNQTWYFQKAITDVAQGYGILFKISKSEMERYSTEDAMDKIQRINHDQAALDQLDFLIQDSNFFYVREANDRDNLDYLTGEALYALCQGVFNFELFTNLKDSALITRQMVVRLLEDDSVQDAIETNTDFFYLNTMKSLLTVAKNTVDNSIAQDKDALSEEIATLLDNASELNSYASTLRQGGLETVWTRLSAQLLSVGGAELTQKALDTMMWSQIDAVRRQAITEECDRVSKELAIQTKIVDACAESAELWEMMVTIAAANEEATRLLDMLLFNLSAYTLNNEKKYDAVLLTLTEIRLGLENAIYSKVSDFTMVLARQGIDYTTELTAQAAMDALSKVFGFNVGIVHTILKCVFNGMDEVFAFGENMEYMHMVQIGTLLSRAMGYAVVGRNRFNPATDEEAMYQLTALKYLIKLRLICESYYTGVKARDPEALDYINSVTGQKFESITAYSNYITALLLRCRDQIYSPVVGTVTIPEAPTVTLNYKTMTTAEPFPSTYEYSFDGDTWIVCDAVPIALNPGPVPRKLRVRLRETDQHLAGMIATLTVPAQPVILGDIQVLRRSSAYEITGLPDGWYDYQFANEASDFTATSSVWVLDGRGRIPATEEYVYLAVQAQKTDTSFPSRVRWLTVKDPKDDWIIVESDRQTQGDPGGNAMTAVAYFQDVHQASLVTITDHRGEEVAGTALLGTGYRLIADGQTYVVVIRGDVNGDTQVDRSDFQGILDHLEGSRLTDAYLAAGCITSSEEPDIFDAFCALDYISTGSFIK